MKRWHKGFTVVELMTVIVVIGILTGISVFGYNMIQNDARDSRRDTQAQLIAEALEASFRTSGEYPGCGLLTQDANTVTGSVLSGIDKATLSAPLDSSDANSISCDINDLDDTSVDKFVFVPTDDSAVCSSGTACLSWVIRYRQSDGTIAEIESRGQAVATSALKPNLSVTGSTINSISLSWNAIANATGYNLRYSPNPNMSDSTSVSVTSGTTHTVSSLSSATNYYFSVYPVVPLGNGETSNVARGNTLVGPPSTPTTSAAIVGNNAVGTVSFVSCGGSADPEYQLRSRKAAGSMGSWSSWSSWSDERIATIPADYGWTHQFQAQVRCASDDIYSDVVTSNVASVVRPIPAPSTPNLTVIIRESADSPDSTAEATVSAISCHSGTTAQYRFQSRLSATSSMPGWSAWSSWGTSRTNSITANQGWRHEFQAQARCVSGSVESSAATTGMAFAVRNLSAPSTPTLSNSTSGNNTTWTWSTVSCPTGASLTNQIEFSNNGGLSGSYSWTTPPGTSASQNTSTQGVQYTMQVRARCATTHHTGPWSGTRTSNYTRAISAPSAPALGASISGSNAQAASGVAVCSSGTTAQYRFRNRGSATTTYPAWSAWSSWGTGRTNSVAANQGWRYEFTAQVRCVRGTTNSSAVTTNTAAVTRTLSAPSMPTLSNSVSGNNTTWTWSTVSCPTGASLTNQLQYSNNSNTSTPTGSYTWTTRTGTTKAQTTSTQGIIYTKQIRARCATAHTTGPWSGTRTSNYTRAIALPTNPRDTYRRVNARQITITGTATCSGSTTIYARGDTWVSGWNWRPPVGPSSGTATGWTSAYNGGNWWWNDYYIAPLETGAVSSSNISTSSRWQSRFQFRCYQTRTNLFGPATSTYTTSIYNF